MTKPKVYVSPFALAAIAMFLLFADVRMIIEVAAAVILHELGHLAAMKVLGVAVESVIVEPVGIRILYRDEFVPYAFDAVIAASGPLASLYAAIFTAIPSRIGLTDSLVMFSGLNLMYCIVNLMPITALDGGRIVYSIISSLFSPMTADRVAMCLNIVCLVLMSILGIYAAFITGGGLSLVICASFLAVECAKAGLHC